MCEKCQEYLDNAGDSGQKSTLEDLVNSLAMEEQLPEGVSPIDPLLIDTENLGVVSYDKDEFQRGIDDFSYTAGVITALINAGLSSQQAITFLINRETINHNIHISESENEAKIKITKEQSLLIDNNRV